MYKTIVTALAFSFFAATAFAASPSFEEVDTDKDGAITIEEAAAAGISKDMFTKLDLDQNGVLSAEEYQA